MHSIETTELKLKSTPTGGVEAAHSPYYRRLLSAGYKGFLQGSIGGAGLYGLFGLGIGTLLAVAAAPITGGASLLIIPAATGIGMMKGASTFGNIGSVAAINAESADLSEQRRYLLDRYYDLPNTPEGEREAKAIQQELLSRQNDTQETPPLFHWKTLAIGVGVGALIAFVICSPSILGFLVEPAALTHAIGHLGIAELFGTTAAEIAKGVVIAPSAITATGTAIGALGGGLAGATIGIDRYYIRKWFDHTEGVIHSSSHKETALTARAQQIERLKEAAHNHQPAAESEQASSKPHVQLSTGTPIPSVAPPAPATKAAPTSQLSEARHAGMLEMQKAMDVPTI